MVDAYEKLEEIGKGNFCSLIRYLSSLNNFLLILYLIGSFGSVYKIRRKSNGEELVWKEIAYGKMSDREK